MKKNAKSVKFLSRFWSDPKVQYFSFFSRGWYSTSIKCEGTPLPFLRMQLWVEHLVSLAPWSRWVSTCFWPQGQFHWRFAQQNICCIRRRGNWVAENSCEHNKESNHTFLPNLWEVWISHNWMITYSNFSIFSYSLENHGLKCWSKTKFTKSLNFWKVLIVGNPDSKHLFSSYLPFTAIKRRRLYNISASHPHFIWDQLH